MNNMDFYTNYFIPKLGGSSNKIMWKTDFVCIYVKFCYYFCIYPFRIVILPCKLNETNEGPTNSSIQLKSWLPQKIVCAVSQFFGMFWLLKRCQNNLPNYNNPSFYIRFFHHYVNFFVKVAMLKNAWCNQNDFYNIANFLHNPTTRLLQNVKYRYLIYSFCAINFGLSILAVIGGVDMQPIAALHMWNSTKWLEKMFTEAQHVFLLKSFNSTTSSNVFEYFSWKQYVLIPIATMGFVQKQLLSHFCDLHVLLSTLTLWVSIKAFHDELSQSSMARKGSYHGKVFKYKLNWDAVHEMYTNLQRMSELQNKLVGRYITLYLLEITLYNSIMLDRVFKYFENGDWFGLARYIIFICEISMSLWFAADSCHKVTYLKKIYLQLILKSYLTAYM